MSAFDGGFNRVSQRTEAPLFKIRHVYFTGRQPVAGTVPYSTLVQETEKSDHDKNIVTCCHCWVDCRRVFNCRCARRSWRRWRLWRVSLLPRAAVSNE